ncbi:MAG: hypothetical protein WA966_00175, partial [Ornithinimicrobium sp.]
MLNVDPHPRTSAEVFRWRDDCDGGGCPSIVRILLDEPKAMEAVAVDQNAAILRGPRDVARIRLQRRSSSGDTRLRDCQLLGTEPTVELFTQRGSDNTFDVTENRTVNQD